VAATGFGYPGAGDSAARHCRKLAGGRSPSIASGKRPDQGSHLLVGRGQIGGRRVRLRREAIDGDRFPLSPRIAVLRSILAQLRPEPARAPLPPLRNYVPPSKGRYRRRG
jgi:hypothetical protein